MTYHFGKSFLPIAWWEKRESECACLLTEEKGEGEFWYKRNRSIMTNYYCFLGILINCCGAKKLQFQNPKSEGFVWTCIRVPKNTKHHYITLLEAHSILSVPKLRIWYYSSSVVARPWVWSDATVRFWCTAIGPCSQSLPKTNFQEYIKVDTFIRWLKSIKSKSLDNVYDYSFISNRIDCCHTDNHYWRFKRMFSYLALLSKFCKFYGINQIKFNV